MYKAPFYLKTIPFKNNLFLAPLTGITDKAFRSFVRRFHPGFMFSEMIPVSALSHNADRLSEYIDIPEEAEDTGIQVIGNEPGQFEEQVNRIKESSGIRWIDINCGCSVPRVLKQKCGAYLLREPELCRNIFRGVRKAFDGICSVKIRAGWDRQSLNYHQISAIAFEEGLDVVFFHPRTVQDRFNIPAEWDWAADLKKSFPGQCIFGNGDLFTMPEIVQSWKNSGVDGLLLARGAMKSPWIFEQIQGYFTKTGESPPGLEERISYVFDHLDRLIEQKGETKAAIEIRKFIGWYLSGYSGIRELRKYLPFMKTRKDVVRFIQIVYNMTRI